MKYVRLVWSRYLADSTYMKAIRIFEEQKVLIKLACLRASAAIANVEVLTRSLHSSSAMFSDEES